MASYDESIPDLIRGTIRDGIGLVRDEIFWRAPSCERRSCGSRAV